MRPVRSSCAGGAGCLEGKVARQARPPGSRGHQAGEAGQAIICWGGRVTGRQGHQAGQAARQPSLDSTLPNIADNITLLQRMVCR